MKLKLLTISIALATIFTSFVGCFIAGNFDWQTWGPFGKFMLVILWLISIISIQRILETSK